MASSRPRRDVPETDRSRVLYVDRGAAGDVAERAIERLGATPIEAVGGTDALKRLAVGAIDAVVLPPTLPDVSTATVIDRVAGEEPGVPVVVVGAEDPPGTAATGLPEDVPPAELADRLRRLTDDRRLEGSLDRHGRLEDAVLRIVLRAAEAEDRRDVEAVVRDRLLETEAYRHVWVHTTTDGYEPPGEALEPDGTLGALLGATDESVLERALEAGEPVAANAHGRIDTADAAPASEREGLAELALVAVPLAYHGRARGVLVLTTVPAEAPDGPERELLAGLGRVVGAILDADRARGSGGASRLLSTDRFEALAGEVRAQLREAASALEAAVGPEAERAREAIATADDLLDAVVEIAAGGTIENPVETDVHELAVRVWPSVRTDRAELTLGEPVVVEAEPALLERLLAILMEAVLEGAGSGAAVRVGALPEDRGFAVEADGRALSTDVVEAIAGDGTGVADGSAPVRFRLARVVIEVHGWTISVEESDDGRIEVRTGTEPGS